MAGYNNRQTNGQNGYDIKEGKECKLCKGKNGVHSDGCRILRSRINCGFCEGIHHSEKCPEMWNRSKKFIKDKVHRFGPKGGKVALENLNMMGIPKMTDMNFRSLIREQL